MTAPDERALDDATRVVRTGDGSVLTTRTIGTGPTVLLVHGALSSGTDWQRVVALLLDAGMQVVTFDQRGHGSSSVGFEGFSIPAYGDDVATVMAELDLQDVVAVGHSMGGMALLSYFARGEGDTRGRLSGVVLVSTAARGLGRNPVHRLMSPLVRLGLVDLLLRRPRLGNLMVRRLFGRGAQPSLIEEARRSLASAPRAAKIGAPLSVLEFDLTGVLSTIDIPAAVLVGSQDRNTTEADARDLAARLPRSDLRVEEGAGHFLILERPGAVVDAILRIRKLADESP